jgi:hypothetical protein
MKHGNEDSRVEIQKEETQMFTVKGCWKKEQQNEVKDGRHSAGLESGEEWEA